MHRGYVTYYKLAEIKRPLNVAVLDAESVIITIYSKHKPDFCSRPLQTSSIKIYPLSLRGYKVNCTAELRSPVLYYTVLSISYR